MLRAPLMSACTPDSKVITAVAVSRSPLSAYACSSSTAPEAKIDTGACPMSQGIVSNSWMSRSRHTPPEVGMKSGSTWKWSCPAEWMTRIVPI